MSKSKRYDYSETRKRVEQAHQRVTGEALGDVGINVLIKHNAWLVGEMLANELRQFNLSHPGYIVMVVLHSMPDDMANPSDLCLYTGETRANMTRICDELVEQGMVRRVPSLDDRRRVDISLTESGVAMLEQAVPEIRQRNKAIYSVFDADEKAQFEALLLKLMRSMEANI